MFEGFLAKSFYGNTVVEWATALAIIVAAVVVGKALYWVCSKVLRQLTSRTDTKLDDIVLDMIEEPIVFAIAVLGIWFGLGRLHLPEAADAWIWNSIQRLPVVRKGASFTVWALGIIVALNNAGYDVAAVLAGLGIGGIALAMAAKDTVSNVFGGFTIFTDRPFKINDSVRVDGYEGRIS